MKIQNIIKKQLKSLVEQQSESHISEQGTYMVLQNLVLMKENIEKILSMKNHRDFPKCVTGEHAWAGDHIATSKDDIEEVHNFLMTKQTQSNINEESIEIETPNSIKSDLEKNGFKSLNDLFKKEKKTQRDSLSQETKKWIQSTLRPKFMQNK